ncbi:MAG: HD domain-containing protein [Desulfuromonas thiophila]|nr:HD domain-containing protein [Desulfuromonas thiophila]
MKSVYIEAIRERDQVDSLFLVRDKTLALAKNGKPYMTLRLMDRTGEVEARVWDRVDQLDSLFAKDDFIRVRAKASVYLGKMQLVVSDLQSVAEEQVDLADFLPVSSADPQQMLQEVLGLIAAMTDGDYRRLLQAFFTDADFVALFCQAPAAKSMHHVYLGGLLEHSLSVARLAGDVCRRYPAIDADLLLCGALLHDIGKVAELRYRRSFDYTDEGKLIGHIVMGVEMIDERLRQLADFPPLKAMLIKHLLLAHHGQYDYGSPKRPKTLEAVVLNFIDDLDSKINGVSAHIERETAAGSDWTSYHRLYDRYFFRPATAGRTTSATPLSPRAESAPSAQVVTRPCATPASAPAAPAMKTEAEAGKTAAKTARPGSGPLKASLADQLAGLNLELFSDREEAHDR